MDKIDELFEEMDNFFMGYYRPLKKLIDLKNSLDKDNEEEKELYNRIDYLFYYLDKIYLTDYAYELED